MEHLTSVLLAGFTLLLVIAITKWETDELTSPGPLHPVHQGLEELQGSAGCGNCHSREDRDLATACSVCHEQIAEQVQAGKGLHGSLGAGVRVCGACHVEHVGDHVALSGPHAFEAAGIERVDAYDHRHVTGFGLSGTHQTLECSACHEHADAAVLPQGERRFLGLTQACASCHHDPHAGDLGADCASCHSQDAAFELAAAFEHDPRFPLADAHVQLACKDCHEPGSLNALQERGTRAVRACSACHENPHDAPGASAPGSHLRLGAISDCTKCHDTTSFEHSRVSVSATDHVQFAFALEGPHLELACAKCHDDRYTPGTDAGDCAACHDTPHTADFVSAVGAKLGTAPDGTCSACHEFADDRFSLPAAKLEPALHTATGFALDAPHERALCVDCHPGPGEELTFARRYPGRAKSDCAQCHEDPHSGQFDENRACTECHDPRHFEPTTFDFASHAKTAFPLRGAHEAVACVSCHKVETVRPGAQARQFVNTQANCDSCHADPHDGKFDVQPGGGCASCHNETNFRDVKWRAEEHSKWTDFPLRGAHAAADCSSCHGRPFQQAQTTCAACHEDIHAGQFASQGTTDCARCHSESHTFKELAFDHARHSRFKLDETHVKLACSACHKGTATRTGVNVIRYKPLGTACRDCHDARGGRR